MYFSCSTFYGPFPIYFVMEYMKYQRISLLSLTGSAEKKVTLSGEGLGIDSAEIIIVVVQMPKI